ncbi:uncharacterized protein LOC120667653 [Panicum virgatum]|uniref:Uncharacterized protein n=1 Tax=Panicum virgatum TaxID=38727 RepID=A0A8T0UBI1_PANVG|nr:uncharacterized protein LOC120667653 [Panicum virgatum]KAG2618396.1 hypothetical protein PVAP13_3NG079555 [Panicum virgatum]
MASAKDNVPLAPQSLPRQTSNARPPPPQRPKVANGATEPAGGGVVLKCTCFRLPSRSNSKKKTLPPPPPALKISSASRRSAVVPDDVPRASASHSRRVTFRASASHSRCVTFLASASLATWWPASPSAAASAGAAGGSAAPPRRASASSAPPRNAGAAGDPRASSSSFSHWRRSLSPRVMPHGGRASFSFPASPASASSSCMSTPKIPQGCQQQG